MTAIGQVVLLRLRPVLADRSPKTIYEKDPAVC
jgi:hypothetical protein